jgi:hypothetical protein
MKQAEVVQGLFADCKETYDKVKEGVRILASVNTLPVRRSAPSSVKLPRSMQN